MKTKELKALSKARELVIGSGVILGNSLSARHVTILRNIGFLHEITRGWYIFCDEIHKEQYWQNNMLTFLKNYLEGRFDTNYCLGPMESLILHTRSNQSLQGKIHIYTGSKSTALVDLAFGNCQLVIYNSNQYKNAVLSQGLYCLPPEHVINHLATKDKLRNYEKEVRVLLSDKKIYKDIKAFHRENSLPSASQRLGSYLINKPTRSGGSPARQLEILWNEYLPLLDTYFNSKEIPFAKKGSTKIKNTAVIIENDLLNNLALEKRDCDISSKENTKLEQLYMQLKKEVLSNSPRIEFNLKSWKNPFANSLRQTPVRTCGDYIPTDPAEIKNCLDRYVLLMSESHKSHPYTIAVLAHFGISYIEPWASGNGLMARIFLNYFLASHSYSLLTIPSHSSNIYINSLTRSLINGDILTFAEFINSLRFNDKPYTNNWDE
ncbi:MAG: Fic family protein [Lentisphaeria bacterium]|nr:Fic family protein [Lentisphaeria bacterium]NQZ70664.1 Fic family protein [Lentisphaeria bacterium]